MSKQEPTPLKDFLDRERLSQAEVVRGTGLSSGFVSLLVNGQTGASLETINAILGFLSSRLGRQVTYEETFVPAASDVVATEQPAEARG